MHDSDQYRRVWRGNNGVIDSIGLSPGPSRCVVEEEEEEEEVSSGTSRKKDLARPMRPEKFASAVPSLQDSTQHATRSTCVRRHELLADDRPSLSAHMASLMPQACARCWRRKQRVCFPPKPRQMIRES
jgi:hypothetical protein